MPSRDIPLETADSTYYHFKTDIFKHEMTYSTDKGMPVNLVTISAERASEVIALNKRGEKPLQLAGEASTKGGRERHEFVDLVGQESVTRFDKAKKKKKKGGGGNQGGGNQNQPNNQPNQPNQRPNNQGGNQGGGGGNPNNNNNKPRRQQQQQQQRNNNNHNNQRRENRQQKEQPKSPAKENE
jgi:hypothetical protein